MLASNWQPTAHLCWIGGKLQQKWTRDCSDYRDVGGQRPLRHAWVEHEWREVPTEDLPPLRAEMETPPALTRHLTASEAESFVKTLQSSPRRVQETSPVQAVCDRAAHLADVPTPLKTETGESHEAEQQRNLEWDRQREQIAPGKIPPGPKDPRPAGCTCGDWKNPRCLIHSTSKNR